MVLRDDFASFALRHHVRQSEISALRDENAFRQARIVLGAVT
jgi:hypothetical protein